MCGNMARARLVSAVDTLIGWEAGGSSGSPVPDLWKIYLQTKPRAGKDTLNRRRRISAQFIKWINNHSSEVRSLNEVTPRLAQAFADWLEADQPAGGKSQNNRIGNLKTVFSAVAARAGMQSNPFSLVQRADEKDSGHGRAFTRGEESALLAVCRENGTEWHWYEASVMARYTGLRLIDIAGLKSENIHGDQIELVPSKTERHEIKVVIPLHPKAFEALTGLPKRGFLFEKLAHHYATTKKRTGYTDLIRTAKIEPNGAVLSFHCWRHTFRTRLAEAGVSQDVAMKLGGWTNAATAEIYNHDLTRVKKAIMALD